MKRCSKMVIFGIALGVSILAGCYKSYNAFFPFFGTEGPANGEQVVDEREIYPNTIVQVRNEVVEPVRALHQPDDISALLTSFQGNSEITLGFERGLGNKLFLYLGSEEGFSDQPYQCPGGEVYLIDEPNEHYVGSFDGCFVGRRDFDIGAIVEGRDIRDVKIKQVSPGIIKLDALSSLVN